MPKQSKAVRDQPEKVQVFLSCSGEGLSNRVANSFKENVLALLQEVEPYIFWNDAFTGSWYDKLISKLTEADFGIIFLTKDNFNSPRILFEAGAIEAGSESASRRLMPLLINLNEGFFEKDHPFATIHTFHCNQKSLFDIVEKLNSVCPHPMDLSSLEKFKIRIFDVWYQDKLKPLLAPSMGSSEKDFNIVGIEISSMNYINNIDTTDVRETVPEAVLSFKGGETQSLNKFLLALLQEKLQARAEPVNDALLTLLQEKSPVQAEPVNDAKDIANNKLNIVGIESSNSNYINYTRGTHME